MVALNFILQQVPDFVVVFLSAVFSAVYFYLLSVLSHSKIPNYLKIVIPVLVLIGLIVVTLSVRTFGVASVQSEKIGNAGFTYYIPNPEVEGLPEVREIKPRGNGENSYNTAVEIELDDLSSENGYHSLFEYKYENALDNTRCVKRSVSEIVAAEDEINGCSIIYQEGNKTMYYAPGLAGNGGYEGPYFVFIGTTKITTDYNKEDVDTGRKILENLVQLEEKDYSKYASDKTPAPLPLLFN
jgi:hypothetical protein